MTNANFFIDPLSLNINRTFCLHRRGNRGTSAIAIMHEFTVACQGRFLFTGMLANESLT